MEEILIKNLLDNPKLVNNKNYIFGKPRMRVSITKLKEKENNYSRTKDVFPTYSFSDYWRHKDDFSSSVQEKSGFRSHPYKKNGDRNSPNYRGGLIIDFSDETESIQETYQDMKDYIQESPSWATIF